VKIEGRTLALLGYPYALDRNTEPYTITEKPIISLEKRGFAAQCKDSVAHLILEMTSLRRYALQNICLKVVKKWVKGGTNFFRGEKI